jgi:HEAT repeat protein
MARWCLGFAILVVGACRTAPPPAPAPRITPEQAARQTTDALERDVLLLGSRDFVTRSRAAERLVSAGERALPAIGAAGTMPVPVPGGETVSATQPVVREILSELEFDAVREQLRSPSASLRAHAAEELGQRGQWSAIPRLIDRLGDADADVRAAAASSLRRLTNRFFGFQSTANLARRVRAERRWRSWWSVEGRARGEERAPGRSG